MEDLSGFSMLELFRLEADTQTAALSAAVVDLEGAAAAAPALESMMRAAHSLKGAARIVGLEPAVKVAHALEDVFVSAGRGRLTLEPAHADTLLAGVDFLAAIARADDALAPDAPWNARADALVTRLERLAAEPGVAGAAAATPPPPPAPAAPAPAAPAPPPEPAAESGPVPEAASRGPEVFDRVVRVSADSLSRLVGLAGESLVETRQLRPFVDRLLALRAQQVHVCDGLTTIAERLEAADPASAGPLAAAAAALRERADEVLATLARQAEEFEGFARRNEDLAHRLHHEVIVSRMRPLADGIRGFPRLVRDVARSLGKHVRLEIRGEQTGVDRDILDKLEAPLSHLLRNAIDHGIEPPEARRAAGKPEIGTLVLDARHRGGMLHISVTDDGRGVSVEDLRGRAVAAGLVAAAVAARLSEPELLEFLFLPGFSTRDRVTEISGRGVGLDVVQSMVKAVGGGVRVTTIAGQQTSFLLQLPITMSVVRALIVDIAGEPYAFPLTRIDRIVFCRRDEIRTVEGRQYFDREGAAIGLVPAARILELADPGPVGDPLPVVVLSDRGQQFGLIVDSFRGERDLEVRPLDPRLGRVPDVNSASLLENGDPVLIVDAEDIVRSIDNVLEGRRLPKVDVGPRSGAGGRRKRILVVDDSITVRELERQLLQARGFLVDVAVDGMDGWNALRNAAYDLVVTDVDMPRMDGVALVVQIRADPLRRTVPVVIVSYKDREEDRLRGLEAGADRYLTKGSFHDETFIHTIVDLVGEPAE
jgi:two-component system sensor histidine kinase and response regulator WspE